MQKHTDHEHPPTSFAMYIFIWLCLVGLTGVTVGVSYIDMKNAAVLLAVMIATVKVLLVLAYFMHLRFAKPAILYMVITAVLIYGVFFGLTMVDYWYR